jgi:hypothetical protein
MLNLKEISLPVGIGVILGILVATYVRPETEEGYAVLILLSALVSYVVARLSALLLKSLRRSSWLGRTAR